MKLDIETTEPLQFSLFKEAILNIDPIYPTMIEIGCGKPEYSFFFSYCFENECLSICTDIRKKTIEESPKFHPSGKYYYGFSGDRVHIQEGLENIEENPPKILINDLFIENNIKHVDIFHVDAQGSELSILLELVSFDLLKNIEWFFISIHSQELYDRCLEIFERLKGRFYFSSNDRGGYGDGLIVFRQDF